jgi:lauroyl/myristoyl acyltransferase
MGTRGESILLQKIKGWLRTLFTSLYLGFDVLLFYPLLCLLPYGWAFPITRWRGNIHFRLMKGLRSKMLRDLAGCLPERNESERLEIARRVFQMQATFFYENYMWTRYREKTWTKKFVSFQGLEYLDASLEKGKGLILCTMHFNHYFYPGGYLIGRGYEVAPYAVWPWDMKKVNFFMKLPHAYMMWMSERKTRVRYILAGRQPKGEIERRLAENSIFFVLLDIPLPEKQDLRPVTFLGQEALFPSSVIHLQHKTQVPFHVMYMVRDLRDWRRQTVIITPELAFSGDVDRDLQVAVAELEKGIRQHPMFWWGWGMVDRMRPEHIRMAQARKDFSTRTVKRS